MRKNFFLKNWGSQSAHDHTRYSTSNWADKANKKREKKINDEIFDWLDILRPVQQLPKNTNAYNNNNTEFQKV